MHVEEVGILHALLVFVAVALAAAGRPGGRAIDCLESLVLSRPGHTARTAQVAFCPVPAGAGRPVDRKTSQKLSLICWFPYRWCVAHQPPRAPGRSVPTVTVPEWSGGVSQMRRAVTAGPGVHERR
jgi:hypothetical protein